MPDRRRRPAARSLLVSGDGPGSRAAGAGWLTRHRMARGLRRGCGLGGAGWCGRGSGLGGTLVTVRGAGLRGRRGRASVLGWSGLMVRIRRGRPRDCVISIRSIGGGVGARTASGGFRPRLLVWHAGSLRGSGGRGGAGGTAGAFGCLARAGADMAVGTGRAGACGRAAVAVVIAPGAGRCGYRDGTGRPAVLVLEFGDERVQGVLRVQQCVLLRERGADRGLRPGDLLALTLDDGLLFGAELVQSAEPVLEPGHQSDAAGELAVVQPDDPAGQLLQPQDDVVLAPVMGQVGGELETADRPDGPGLAGSGRNACAGAAEVRDEVVACLAPGGERGAVDRHAERITGGGDDAAGCRVDVADSLLGGGDRGAGLLGGDLQGVLVVGVPALGAGELLEFAFQLGLLDQPGLAGADRGDFRVAVRVVIGCLDRPDGGVAVLDDPQPHGLALAGLRADRVEGPFGDPLLDEDLGVEVAGRRARASSCAS